MPSADYCGECDEGNTFSADIGASHCQSVTQLCPAGTEEAAKPTLSTNRQCRACVINVGYKPHEGNEACVPVTACGFNEEQEAAPSATADRVCVGNGTPHGSVTTTSPAAGAPTSPAAGARKVSGGLYAGIIIAVVVLAVGVVVAGHHVMVRRSGRAAVAYAMVVNEEEPEVSPDIVCMYVPAL